tara:strand:- start:2061 stop:2300 length:240 start_codon:yes stop_codon:yes gene_type:complete
MFPLIAISSFFILAIAFFIIGKDDFGIKKIKEASNDTLIEEKVVINPEPAQNGDSGEEKKELVSAEKSSEIESSINASD